MLHPLVFFLFIFSFNKLLASCPQENTCSAHLQEDFLKAIKVVQKDKEFQSFLTESLKQRDSTLEDPGFQNFVTALQAQTKLEAASQAKESYKSGELYIFVSFSLGEKALLNLAQEAKAYNATLILRGFREGSYAQTVKALQNIILKTMSPDQVEGRLSGDRSGEGQGFIIDPELFNLFSISSVPTYVLSRPFQLNASERAQTPLHDRLQGHVSFQHALETFAQSGDLQEEAKSLLTQTSLKRGKPK